MKKLYAMALVAMLAAPSAFAGDMQKGMVAGYVTNTSLDLGGGYDDSGNGFGVRGWVGLGPVAFVHGEYQTVGIDLPAPFGAIDLESLRIGGGAMGRINPRLTWLAKGEIIDFGSDADQGGFGAHGGVVFHPNDTFGVGGTLGYITTDDTDGLELNVGVQVGFTRNLAFVGDVRNYMGSADSGFSDFKVFELRAGIGFTF